MDPEEVQSELLPFIRTDSRTDVKVIALHNILGLTGSSEGRELLEKCPKIVESIVNLLEDEHQEVVKDVVKILTNLATVFTIAFNLVTEHTTCIAHLLKFILDAQSISADAACMALCNMTRTQRCCAPVAELVMKDEEFSIIKYAQILCQEQYNKKGCNLKYLGPLVCNLTQAEEVRRQLLDDAQLPLLQRLLPFTGYDKSLMKRAGVVGILKNCCFDTNRHDYLLSDQVDLLPRLLLPLAGPEEYSEEENDLLPPELQYLEPDKQREVDPDLRKMFVEAVYLLCATGAGRKYVRSKNSFLILKSLEKWEQDKDVKLTAHKLIALLIQDEPDKGFQNLQDVQIPDSLWNKFSQEPDESPLYQLPDAKSATSEDKPKGFWVQ